MPKAHRWTRAELELLGTMTDMEVGAEIGLSHASVCIKRQALGIPPFGVGRPAVAVDTGVADADGTPLHDLLGVVRDEELARRFNLSAYRVRRLRAARGLPPVGGARCRSAEIDPDDFGKVQDAEIARKVGLSRARVAALRQQRGIPACPSGWPAEHVALLGRLTDREVAARTGRTVCAVWSKRHRLGIPAVRVEQQRPPSRGRSWTQAEVDLLGTRPDPEVARKIGVSTSAVRRARVDLEVPAYAGG